MSCHNILRPSEKYLIRYIISFVSKHLYIAEKAEYCSSGGIIKKKCCSYENYPIFKLIIVNDAKINAGQGKAQYF